MTDRTFYRIVLAVLAALSLAFGVAGCATAPQPPRTTTGVHDDPTTPINEGAVLDTSRVQVTAPTTRTSTDLARDYARATGLTGCVAPDQGELSDVYVMRAVHPVDGLPYNDTVFEGDLDQALASDGKRIVLLACDARTNPGTHANPIEGS